MKIRVPILNPWAKIRDLRQDLHTLQCRMRILQERERCLLAETVRLKTELARVQQEYTSPEALRTLLESLRRQ